MAELFTSIDPRGRKVKCSEERWNNHIVNAKPFMGSQLDNVKKAIIEPDCIVRDVDYNNRECYYKLMPKRETYMKVVVEFKNNFGTVITAFRTGTVKKGERVIWVPSSQQ